ncbi:hypothetical protein [Blastopirellula marina]|uniref:Uncharacterized protein n=1 Tax=Blastopirellula marina TaxID=124 RepID=A0A2S8GSJ4_9BACT|nr:hypothetical protein [Blastopirellula marina]PQO47397.1 hypothetical protein C5Y93_04965 [Blastopirellula marina]
MAKDVPRWVWEEQISELREKIAAGMKAAAEGNNEEAARQPEREELLKWLLHSYSLRFQTDYVLAKED